MGKSDDNEIDADKNHVTCVPWRKAGVACAILVALFGSMAEAAVAKKRVVQRPSAAKKASSTEVLVSHLFVNSQQPGETLTDTCGRADFKNLAIALNMNQRILAVIKGEYETTAQFEARSLKLSEILNVRKTVFCQPLDDNEDLPFAYSADDQAFHGSVSSAQNVWRDTKRLGSYRSKTRMGIPATIRASAEYEYNVALDLPYQLKGCLAGTRSYNFTVPSPITAAPALKARGYLAFIGALVPPYIEKSEQSGSPTLDDPNDVYEAALTVHFKPERLVVIDGSGKEVWSCEPGASGKNLGATPTTSATSFMTNDDYPSGAMRRAEQGTVSFSATVGTDGRVKDCTIVASSGSAELDQATCTLITRRGRFEPATDASGHAKEDTYANTVRWALPTG